MESNEFVNLDSNSQIKHRRFPVLAQLTILFVLIGLLFSSLFIPSFNKQTPKPIPQSANTINTALPSLPIISEINPPTIKARSVYVYDVRANRSLYAKNADEKLPLASITKLMTVLVAYELMSPEAKISVPKSAINQTGSSGMSEGEIFTLKSLSDYAMLASSNDAAHALGEAVGDEIGSKNTANVNFVSAMNIRARELELASLQFYNSTGLDVTTNKAGGYGNARDVTFLMKHILSNYPEIIETTRSQADKIYNDAGAYHEAENTNDAIEQIPGLLGSKTGYTDLAGGNLTIAFDAGYNRPIIITVLGSTYDERFSDVIKIVESVTEAFRISDDINN